MLDRISKEGFWAELEMGVRVASGAEGGKHNTGEGKEEGQVKEDVR